MTKKTIFFIIIAGFIWFLVLVVGKMPAALIANNLAREVNGFVPSNVGGTIWQGQASVRVTALQPAITIDKLRWTISPIKLLLGEFDAVLDIKVDSNNHLKGNLQYDLFDQAVTLTNLTGSINSALIQPHLHIPFKINSQFDVDIKRLSAVDRLLTKLDGRVLIKSLSVNMGQNIELGTYAADLSLLDNKPIFVAKLQDIDAVVSVSGQAQWSPTLGYFVDLVIKPSEQANPAIDNTLKNFYPQKSDGSYNVTIGRVLN